MAFVKQTNYFVYISNTTIYGVVVYEKYEHVLVVHEIFAA